MTYVAITDQAREEHASPMVALFAAATASDPHSRFRLFRRGPADLEFVARGTVHLSIMTSVASPCAALSIIYDED